MWRFDPDAVQEGREAIACKTPRVGALAVTFREDEVVLVQRRNEPERHSWGFAGGSVNFGEPIQAAALRELNEETGLDATAHGTLPVVEYFGVDSTGEQHHFLLVPVLCRYVAGQLSAKDDVIASRWVRYDQIASLSIPVVQGVVETALEGARRLRLKRETHQSALFAPKR